MAVTSQIKSAQGGGEFQVNDWQGAGLLKPSVVKPVITSIEKHLIIKTLGRCKENDQSMLRQKIKAIFGWDGGQYRFIQQQKQIALAFCLDYCN